MKVLDLFSGVGMFSYGLEKTGGFETVAFCEKHPYRRQVLEKHWCSTPIFEDVKHVTAETLRQRGIDEVDAICAGFPCQPVSEAAGHRRKGQADERWLWPDIARLIGELRPRYVLLENTAGLVTAGDGAAFGEVIGDLASLWYDAEWQGFSASSFGAWHQRERIWIVAYPDPERPNQQAPQQATAQDKEWYMATLGTERRTEFYAAGPDSKAALGQARWTCPAGVFRVDDGDASKLDELRARACGDSIVWQIVEFIGYRILARELAG